MSRDFLEAFPILDWRGGVYFMWARPFRLHGLPEGFQLPGLDGDFVGVRLDSPVEFRNGLASGLSTAGRELFGDFIVGRLKDDGLVRGLKPWELRMLIVTLDLIYDEELGMYEYKP